jgi:outer membrane protein insertion porin family
MTSAERPRRSSPRPVVVPRPRGRLACVRLTLTLAVIALTFSPSAAADVRDYLGRTLVDVRVELGGTATTDPSILQFLETRLGERLSMAQIRDTIDHLVGLGRFEDIRVFAESSAARPDGVALRWTLAPVQRVERIAFEGQVALDHDTLRDRIRERLGPLPATSRVSEMVQTLAAYYGERGFRAAAIEPRITAGDIAERVTLTLVVQAGVRTTVGAVTVEGDPGTSTASLLSALRLVRGQPYDRSALDERVTRVQEGLRALGHYEARTEVSPRFSADGTSADVTVTVVRGPRVRVAFAGDPLPENRREDLVPISQERSIDLDLLEDASRNIEAYLRQQGYRDAQAPYVREGRTDETVITFTVRRGPLHRLATMDIVGNTALTAGDVNPLLRLQPNEPFVDARVSAVAAALTELYRVRGFARVAIKPEIAVSNASAATDVPRQVTVRLVVTEGPLTTVGSVVIEGAKALPEPQLRTLLTLTPERPFYRPQLDADREALERLYRNAGFQGARVSAETMFSADGRRLDVRWSVQEGERTLIDHVLITGTKRTSETLIRRELTLQPGSPLGDDAIIESQRRLAALGLFRRVRIVDLPHAASNRRDILVELEEAPATTLSYGGGLEAGLRSREGDQAQAEDRIEVAPRAFFQVGRRNLWGTNRSVNLFTRVSLRSRDPAVDSTDPTDEGGYGFNEYRVLGTFREPRPFGARGDLQLSGFLEQAIRTSFNFSRRGVRAEYARPLRGLVTVSGRYALDRTRLFDERIDEENRLNIDRLFPQVRLSTFTASLIRDSRNDLLDPERGAVIGVDGTLAARRMGSEVGFVRSFMQMFVYRRLPGPARLTVAAGARFGFARGFERPVEALDSTGQPILNPDGTPVVTIANEVPASERFFAGGDTTVRGFVLDRLGTDDTLNDKGFPIGGNGLAVVNLELRTPYWKGLGGVGFLDAGNVFEHASEVSLTDLRPAAGFGLRYRSPVGPLRVDLGFNLDRRNQERGTVFHISLGQAF